jgi:hypothetical protein
MIARRGFLTSIGAALAAIMIPFRRAQRDAPRYYWTRAGYEIVPEPVRPKITWIESFVEKARGASGPVAGLTVPPGDGANVAAQLWAATIASRYERLGELDAKNAALWNSIKRAQLELVKGKTNKRPA